jgi:hypothetical protein
MQKKIQSKILPKILLVALVSSLALAQTAWPANVSKLIPHTARDHRQRKAREWHPDARPGLGLNLEHGLLSRH